MRHVWAMECFHSRGQHLCKFIGTKESVCIRKEFNSHRTGLGHQHGRRFIVLGHQHGHRDVMWKHSIYTGYQSPHQVNCVITCAFWTNGKVWNEVPFGRAQVFCTRNWHYFKRGLFIYMYFVVDTWNELPVMSENDKSAGLWKVKLCSWFVIIGPFIRGKIRRVLNKTRTVPFIGACLT